ncbi:MAG: glycoside hydrolase family 172 protein, partial [Armatimonadota bacterium]
MSIPRLVGLPCCLTALVLLALSPASAQATRVTIESLLHEMIDLERLATVPDPGVECDQQSSYDRASVSPDQEGWFANGDAGKFIRQEQHDGRTEHVMAEMDGPGAILRLWSANPQGGGNIRIYIDDLDNPALEADFLALTSAQMPEFPAPFSGIRSRGANLYFPIPYQQRCKVTVDKPSLYYQVGYRTFPPGTQVQPFSMQALAQVRQTMHEVGTVLAAPELPPRGEDPLVQRQQATIAPGEEAVLHQLSGPRAIVRLALKVDVPDDQLFAALRECLLTITFDDETEPSVWCPLGDFFGSTPGLNTYQSLPVGMKEDGTCYSNWYMPFAKSARIAVRNDSDNPVKLSLSASSKPAAWQEGQTLYFHAKWRNEWLPADPRFLDWLMLEATGPGRFVGVMLGVVNTVRGWWGEGDEKVWVDDDTFPSFFGTGTEDYFGYAWCNPGLFTHAYHNQSIVTGPGNFGYTAVARYHILDDIPFDKSIKFYVEKWAAADREYCCTSYWYAAPGATDFFEPIPVEDRRVRPLPEPFKVQGAIEGEALEIARRTGGTTQVQGLPDGFSLASHLWWLDPEEGSILELKVPVEKAGRYKITLGLTKSWDYGIHQPLVNGEVAGEPLDLCAPRITPLKADLGVFDLEAGDVLIGLRCVGTNPNAKPVRRMAGIDYIL